MRGRGGVGWKHTVSWPWRFLMATHGIYSNSKNKNASLLSEINSMVIRVVKSISIHFIYSPITDTCAKFAEPSTRFSELHAYS